MRDSIYTIPISEVFEEKDDCPICKMRNLLEERCLEYIMGAAMMEPDVRIETNKQGFCKEHYFMMLKRRNRLSLALMLESHLDVVINDVKKGRHKPSKDELKKGRTNEPTCYVCNKIDWAIERMLATIIKLYCEESSFRQLFRDQKCLCLPHYKLLLLHAEGKLGRRYQSDFEKDSLELTLRYLTQVKEDVSYFTRMFDYRNSGEGADFKNSKDAVERSIWYLTSRKSN